MKTKTVGIVVLILVLLTPPLIWAANHLRKRYMRYKCGQNLKALAQAQTVYANNYDDEYTIAGGPHNQVWTTDSNMLWVIEDPNGIPVPASDY